MNKLSNKTLLIIVSILLAVYLGNKYLGNSKDRNFKTELVAVDTTSITKIQIIGKSNNHIPITVKRIGSEWEVSDGTITDKAPISIIQGMLSSLVSIKPSRLVANDKAKWETNEVTDSLGTQVKVFDNSTLLADFVIGKFNFQQSTRTMTTSVRLSNSDEVYTVQGYLSSTFNRKTDDFRNKSFIKTTTADLTKITFSYPADSSFVLSKQSNGWQLDGMAADSLRVNQYLTGLANVSMKEFENGFEPSLHEKLYEITIDGNNMNSITVTGYSGDNGLVLNSTLNEHAYFKQGSFNPLDQLFASKHKF